MTVFHHLSAEKLRTDSARFAATIMELGCTPFGSGDTSVGMEYELQVAVEGDPEDVDLPRLIKASNFFKNTEKRAARGDLPKESVTALRDFLEKNDSRIWENSWVRLDANVLGDFAGKVLSTDFLADKRYADGPRRKDIARFECEQGGRKYLRIPISYLLKIAFADCIDPVSSLPEDLRLSSSKLLGNFQSDNTSPEILSFTIPSSKERSIGTMAARETARTFLVTQLLAQYANTNFGLNATGQKCIIYNAPHAPHRQKKLNELVPDGFYRHLFMSPCLSGWDRGEEKHRYMALCHQTLSRSQLNATSKLKDAGIITNNLVVLPNTSNTCLANNGTHVSLGSKILSRLAADATHSGLTPGVEKYVGDLVIKIVEHFLPLFVNSYTAAPYRVDFADFHPEKVLGFLPHELDYTHLRMIWRRWKKKADIRFLGKSLTPFGPNKLDHLLSKIFRLHGDLIPDFRLVDYFITLLSTESCPALNGIPGNQEQLKNELTEMGIFDSRMSIYLPYRMRSFERMGYSGFEGRIYSLFPSYLSDMAEAVDLQNLVTALAYRLVLKEQVLHQDIPDTPSVESERRQMFFCTAIGIPTIYIRTKSSNRFLRNILKYVKTQRPSKRYRNYTRVKVEDYRLALVDYLHTEAGDVVEEQGSSALLAILRRRLVEPEHSAAGRLVGNTTETIRSFRKPERIPADTFNAATETYYRTELKRKHISEGLQVLTEDCIDLEKWDNGYLKEVMRRIAPNMGVADYLKSISDDVLNETTSSGTAKNLLHLCLTVIHNENQNN